MAQVLVNFRMDADLKKDMETLCDDLGITMTAAFTMFAKKAVREQRIPFDVSVTSKPEPKKEIKESGLDELFTLD